ncbi:MAG: transposase [Planctomycetes bacterium]|nr:transposase [Planctomycetota bacterium]
MRSRCISSSARARTIVIGHGYEALLRTRRKRAHWDEAMRRMHNRHRWRVEGIHGEAKTQHGLRRATRRGLANEWIQVCLTAAVMNLERLAAAWRALTGLLRGVCRHFGVPALRRQEFSLMPAPKSRARAIPA